MTKLYMLCLLSKSILTDLLYVKKQKCIYPFVSYILVFCVTIVTALNSPQFLSIGRSFSLFFLEYWVSSMHTYADLVHQIKQCYHDYLTSLCYGQVMKSLLDKSFFKYENPTLKLYSSSTCLILFFSWKTFFPCLPLSYIDSSDNWIFMDITASVWDNPKGRVWGWHTSGF